MSTAAADRSDGSSSRSDELSLASAVAQGNVVRAICISKGKAHF
jgi:hypothetical protein